MPALEAMTELVRRAAERAGFDAAGIAPAGSFRELEYFRQWIRAGRAGDMAYLEKRSAAGELQRASLAAVAPWARSVIVGAVNYNTAQPRSTEPVDPALGPRGWISRYAWSREDYHDSVLRRLRALEAEIRQAAGPECQTRCYVDTGPVVERIYARYAGVGWIGKNTCLIRQPLGSWLFLGVILTSLALEPGIPAPDRCGTCTRCLDACPTGAFPAPYQMDATRCISYLTIEKRGEIPGELRENVGRHVFGCDICQDVCPWNRKAPVTAAEEFQPREGLVNPALEWLAGMEEEEFRRQFRGSPIKRARHAGVRRNAAIALGNSGDPRAVAALEALAQDEDPVVAEHARWGLEKLKA